MADTEGDPAPEQGLDGRVSSLETGQESLTQKLDKLLGIVRRHNRVSCEAARIQVRIAGHIGPIQHDGHGFVGRDVNYLHRMLDAPALKRKLAASGAEPIARFR